MKRLALAGTLLAALVFSSATPSDSHAAPNDNFTGATTLTAGAAPTLADNLGSTSEPGEPDPQGTRWNDCGSLTARADCGSTVWFTFTPASTGTYTVETCDVSTELDTSLAVFTGAAVGTLSTVGSNDDACDGAGGAMGSRVTFGAAAGTPYRVQISGYAGHTGTFYVRAFAGSSPVATAPAETRLTRYQSVTAGAPDDDGAGVQSGARRTASFAFVSTSANATFECALDAGDFRPCSSPTSLEGVPTDGALHQFRVRAISGGIPDPTPASQRFTVDRTPPETEFTSGPVAGASVALPTGFAAKSSERIPDFLFRCATDGVGTAACNTPGLIGLSNLCNGSHTFGIAGMDGAGNLDPTPATRQFTVTGSTDCSDPTLGAPNVSVGPTQATISSLLTTGGKPVVTTLRYGTTTAYGETIRSTRSPGAYIANTVLRGLTPATTYHYELVASGPSGTTATGDQTFSTPSLPGGAARPALTLDTPLVNGPFAARIPIVTDVGAPASDAQVLVYVDDQGPISTSSPSVYRDMPIPSSTTGPVNVPIDLLDLEPSTTYHYRVLVSGTHTRLSEERTFATPAVSTGTEAEAAGPSSPVAPKPIVTKYFLLSKDLVKISALSRRGRTVTVKIRTLPPGTKVILNLKGRSVLGRVSGRAPASGNLSLKLKLSSKARRALRNRKLRKLRFVLVAMPPRDATSSLTLTRRLP